MASANSIRRGSPSRAGADQRVDRGRIAVSSLRGRDRARGGPAERVIAWFVQPDRVVAGNPTGLFALLWTTGGLWVLLGVALGAFDDGRPALGVGVGVVAMVVGSALLLRRAVALPSWANASITLLGSTAICLVVLAAGAGDAGAGAGVLFVYVTCFSFIAVPRQALAIVALSAIGHLVVLRATEHGDEPWLWAVTWGSALVTGLVAGAVVNRLEDVAVRLEVADGHKDQFLATVSHELRSPLAAILGTIDTLLQHEGHIDPERRAQLHGVIRRQAARQHQLVEDVLQLSLESTRGTVARPTDVVLAPLLLEVTDAAVPDLDVRFELGAASEASTVFADPDHVARILTNLLVNAQRYGEPPVVVRTSAGIGMVRLEVVDQGPGIPGGFEDGALEPFVQGSGAPMESSGGVGLGLAIVQDLVRANDGRLEYATTPGGGATIRVLLPSGAAQGDDATDRADTAGVLSRER